MIQTLYDTGSSNEISPEFDGAIYQVISEDSVIGGVGDEFELIFSDSSLDVGFNAGSQAIIDGAFFRVVDNTTITLTANSVIYLTARIDKGLANGQRGLFYQCTSSNMKDERLNGGGIQRDMLLYVITTTSSGISSVVDMRNIVDRGGGGSRFRITKDENGNTLAEPITFEIVAAAES